MTAIATHASNRDSRPSHPHVPSTPATVAGGPRRLLRLEALALLVASVVGYRALGGSWGVFAALLLMPDVAMLGYLAGPRAGATAYNTAHTLLGPAALAAIAALLHGGSGVPALPIQLALVWSAHIGMDRALGYGLKYATAFGDTHLGRVGRTTTGHASS